MRLPRQEESGSTLCMPFLERRPMFAIKWSDYILCTGNQKPFLFKMVVTQEVTVTYHMIVHISFIHKANVRNVLVHIIWYHLL